jgi:polysaccharide biosynthesis transport protein
MMENGRHPVRPGQERARGREIWMAVRARPLFSVGVPLVLIAATAFFLWWVAPTYEATATLRVDEKQSGVAVLEALQSLSSGSKIGTEMEELRSRTVAAEAVDSLDLNLIVRRPRKVARATLFTTLEAGTPVDAVRYELVAEGAGSFRVSGNGIEPRVVKVGELVELPDLRFVLAPSAAEHQRIAMRFVPFDESVRQFMRTIAVSRPNREADMIRVRFEGRDPAIVEAVPNLLARRFMHHRDEVRTREARSTAGFLDTQLARLTAEIGSTEEELKAYRERHGAISVEAEGEAHVSRLADMQVNRELLQVDRAALAQLMAQIEQSPPSDYAPSPYRALMGFPTLLKSQTTGDLLRTLHELESQRVPLLSRRTAEDPELRALTDQVRALDRQLQDVSQTYLSGLTAQIQHLDGALAGFVGQLQQIPAKELNLARMRRQMKVNEEIYAALQLRLKEAEIMAAVDDPSIRVVDAAVLPRKSIRPDVPLTLALAVLLGTVLGVGGAVVREQLDSTVRTRDDLQVLGGAPVLGSIPRIEELVQTPSDDRRRRRRRGADRVAARFVEDVPGAPVTEAYRSLRTNINFSSPSRRPRILVVTSPAPGDGKSTTAANLALTMHKQGLRCLLIDTDLRRGLLHDLFGVPREPGLSNVLMGERTREEAVRTSDGRPDFLSTGTLPPNPAELLGSDAMAQLLREAAEEYDTVLLDAPPMNLVTDAAVLARVSDGVIVVTRAGVTTRQAIVYTFDQLSSVQARVLGSVLNDADITREKHYGSYMTAYYSSDG